MALRSLNNPLASFIDYLAKTGTDASTPVPGPISATGGVISDYVSGPTIYRSHIFTSSGTFTVTDGAGSVEYLVVGGGAGAWIVPPPNSFGGSGGSGIVLIAYDSA
jgi:hypothetical protein